MKDNHETKAGQNIVRRAYSDATKQILRRAKELENAAADPEDAADEYIVEAVLLCAGRILEIVGPNTPHVRVADRVLEEGDVTSVATLRRMRAVLHAAAETEPEKWVPWWSRNAQGASQG